MQPVIVIRQLCRRSCCVAADRNARAELAGNPRGDQRYAVREGHGLPVCCRWYVVERVQGVRGQDPQ